MEILIDIKSLDQYTESIFHKWQSQEQKSESDQKSADILDFHIPIKDHHTDSSDGDDRESDNGYFIGQSHYAKDSFRKRRSDIRSDDDADSIGEIDHSSSHESEHDKGDDIAAL